MQRSSEWGTGSTVGLDLGDREGVYVVLGAAGEVRGEGRVATSEPALAKLFGGRTPLRVALEAGTHSPWVSRRLEQLGHEVVVANPRALPYITRHERKGDRTDAESLARLARLDPALLRPLRHRSEQAQQDLALVRTREGLVRARTLLINNVRGLAKSAGTRLRPCSAAAFHTRAQEQLPATLLPVLAPTLASIAELSARIRELDRQLEALVAERYPQARGLQQIAGVGALTALTFVLTIEDPARFRRSRELGPYLGLTPRQRQSGERRPELGITKAGDATLRRLLVQCAHYVLGPFGPDTDLRRWGLRLAGAGSGARKKRATVAVARKLAVLLHRLWTTGEVYQPLRNAQASVAA